MVLFAIGTVVSCTMFQYEYHTFDNIVKIQILDHIWEYRYCIRQMNIHIGKVICVLSIQPWLQHCSTLFKWSHTQKNKNRVCLLYKISMVVTQITGSVYNFERQRILVGKPKATSTISALQIYTWNRKALQTYSPLLKYAYLCINTDSHGHSCLTTFTQS